MATGFTSGAKTTAPPAFGTGSITFGTPATQSQPTFGSSTIQSSQATTGGFQLGSTPTATSTNLFGSQPTLNFNKPIAFAAPTTQTGLFGTTTATTTASLQFGGTPTTSVTSTPAASLSFGATTATTNFLNTTSSTAPLTFGVTPASTSSSNLAFGSSSSTATSAAPNLNFGFGSSAPTSSTPTLGASVATSAPSNFGLGGSIANAQQPSLTVTSSAPSLGLGGLATTQTKLTTTQKELPPKDQPLPNEILQTVEQFKEIVKQQKLYSSDIARSSIRDFRKVEQEIDHLTNLLNDVEGQLQKNRQLAEKLKYDTAKCLQNVEMAQRTQDTPPGLQYENTAPLRYFLELADQFEREMQVLKFQIESADKYVKNHKCPDTLTPQDLALGLRRLHETFVALAGRLQSVHSQVESQKETYLNIRKQIYNDHTNPFEKLAKVNNEAIMKSLHATKIYYSPPKVTTGPTPFTNLPIGNGNLSFLNQNQLSSGFGVPTTSATGTGFGTMSFGTTTTQASNTSLFGSTPFGQTSFNTSSSFQLQKPPTGNKRGKQ